MLDSMKKVDSVQSNGRLDGVRVAFITPWAYPLFDSRVKNAVGGAERQFYLFAESLAERGATPVFIVANPALSPLSADELQFPVHFADFSYLGGSKLRMPGALLSIWSALEAADADYYLIKLPRHLLLVLAAFCRAKGKKLVFWVQSQQDFDDTTRHGLDKITSWVQNLGLQSCDVVIAQTNEQSDMLKNLNGIQTSVVRSIFKKFSDGPAEPHDTMGEFEVLWVGSSSALKNYDLMCAVAKTLPQYQFVVAMNRTDFERFEQAERESAKLENVEFLGMVPQTEMDSLFGKAKILLCTSEREGFPNIFLQAWTAGIPVISWCIDPDRLIRDRGFGEYACPVNRDPMQMNDETTQILSGVCRDWLQDSERSEKAGLRGREYVREHHSASATTDSLIGVLKSLG